MRLILVALAAFAILWPVQAAEWGKAQFQSPDVSEWYRSLTQPDSPQSSCCGASDAYWTDDSETGPNGELYAIITDTRPDVIQIEGQTVARPHIPVGTRIYIPPSKIRKHPVPNPEDHGVIFVRWYEGPYPPVVYCYEPPPLT